jgi:hypothetical protein
MAWTVGMLLYVSFKLIGGFGVRFMELPYSTTSSETTSTAMSWWALAMIAHPEYQRCAQAELDAVVGRSRVPTFSDISSLPYIQAIVKEVL